MRPFFSIIIPCHNSNSDRIKDLLISIKTQNLRDDIEVIISDDNSDDISYLDVVKSFEKSLNIKVVYTDTEVHCPGNTREEGVQHATGEWITFMDHDDMLIEDTYLSIKNYIKDNNIEHVLFCNFKEVDPITLEVHKELIHTFNWMHAKFYNLDNFWKLRDMHFKKDLKSHEDIYVSVSVECELHEMGTAPQFCDIFCYLWRAWSDSLSRSYYGRDNYLEYYYPDYLEVGKVFFDKWLAHKDSEEELRQHFSWYALSCIEGIMYQYFYIQGFKYNRPFDYRLDVEMLAKDYIRAFYRIFGVDKNYIINEIYYKHQADWFVRIRQRSMDVFGHPIAEVDSFKDFIDV